ncbi:MAG TPA: hypothetical protein VFT39_13315 [Vicinamibacterales bacterium]|nr:hypothetical protein [Vicinamibacterales bacterium]
MTFTRTCGVICLIVLSLITGSAIGHAQAQRTLKPNNVVVLSGPDIGFRVEGIKESSVTGRFVIRVSGRWVEVENSFAQKPVADGQ